MSNVVSAERQFFGRDLIFEYLVAMDVGFIFGNPGTTEVAFVDGCNDYPSIQYVLALHEDIAVAQAMGYARASGKIGVVNVHVTPGVTHALGNLYNAYRARIPLLVTAGQQHPGLTVHEPILASDLAGLARPFTKWSYEVTRLDELAVALQRAFKELTTPPYGPVFLSLASNLFLEPVSDPPVATISRVSPVRAMQESVDQAARVLASASSPVIIAGDGVGLNDSWLEMVSLAERLAAPVYTEGYATSWNFPSNHPLYAGPMPNLATEMRRRFDDVDVALMCGVVSQAPVARYDEGGPLVPWRVRTVSVDDSSWEIGKNQPAEVGLLGDIKVNLGALDEALRAVEPEQSGAADRSKSDRSKSVVDAVNEQRAERQRRVDDARAGDGLTGALVAAELRELLPSSFVLVDESISNRPHFLGTLELIEPGCYFAVNGLTLGYSVGVAVGMQLARPDRKVVCVVGDGSLLYYPQALWNAASERTPVLFIVLNNAGYNVLKVILERMGGPWTSGGEMPPGLDIDSSRVGFAELAASFGVPGERSENAADLRVALEHGLKADGPYLVEVLIDQG